MSKIQVAEIWKLKQPSYSDIILSQSPSYTPLSSQNSSPSYGSRREPNQDNDSIKNQEDDENDEPED